MKNHSLFIIFIFITTSCCKKENTYKFVKANCTFINYQDDIEFLNKVGINTCEIITYNKLNNKKISSISIMEDISSWDNGIKKINLPKGLSTNQNWKIIINDSLIYSITDVNVEVWGGKTTFCEDYRCVIKDYKLNNVLVSESYIKLQ